MSIFASVQETISQQPPSVYGEVFRYHHEFAARYQLRVVEDVRDDLASYTIAKHMTTGDRYRITGGMHVARAKISFGVDKEELEKAKDRLLRMNCIKNF